MISSFKQEFINIRDNYDSKLYRNEDFLIHLRVLWCKLVLRNMAWPYQILAILVRTFVFIALEEFLIIWLSSLSVLIVPNEGYSINICFYCPRRVFNNLTFKSFGFDSTQWRLFHKHLFLLPSKSFNNLTFKSFGFDSTQWRLFHKRAVCTKLDIYLFIGNM
jgi:hypothetical protein